MVYQNMKKQNGINMSKVIYLSDKQINLLRQILNDIISKTDYKVWNGLEILKILEKLNKVKGD